MSRIDEALRRSGTRADEPVGSSVANAEDVFVSPWALEREPERREASTPSPLTRSRERSHRSSRLLSNVTSTGTDRFQVGWRERLAISSDADPLMVHQFRRLVATLFQAQGSAPIKTLMVTSASPGDGETLTSLNLALVLSESYGRRVLLVEGDLRRPAICAAAGLPGTSEGLSEAIRAAEDRKVSLVQLTELLTLMPAGRPDPDPLSGLTSSRLERLIREASQHFEWVIIDTPPLGAAPDASLMAHLVDAVLLVIHAGQTPYANVQHAIDTLGPERILGVVLNGVGPDEAESTSEYYGHYAPKG